MGPNEQIPDDRNKSEEHPGIPGFHVLTEKAMFGVYSNGQFKTDLSMTENFFNYSGDYPSAYLQNPVNVKQLIGVIAADVQSQRWQSPTSICTDTIIRTLYRSHHEKK